MNEYEWIADDWFENSYDDGGKGDFGKKNMNHHPPIFHDGYGDYDWEHNDTWEQNEYGSQPDYGDYGSGDDNTDWWSENAIGDEFENDEYDGHFSTTFPPFPGGEFDDFTENWDTSERPPFNNNFHNVHGDNDDFGRQGNRKGQFRGNRRRNRERSGSNKMNNKRSKNKYQKKFEKDMMFGGMMLFKDILSCDEMPTCGNGGIMQEIKSCVCESFWSKNSDPTGRLCQAIPKSTREKAVGVISMFMKGNGPAMPKNRTMLRQLKRMAGMWGHKFARLVSTPFEKSDAEVSFIDYLNKHSMD